MCNRLKRLTKEVIKIRWLFASLALVLGTRVDIARAAELVPSPGRVFASSEQIPLLEYPEGIIAGNERVYVSTYNTPNPQDTRIFVFNYQGQLLNTLGDSPDEQKFFSRAKFGGLLGLALDPKTDDLFAAANALGDILRIQNPNTPNPQISVYSTYPSSGGPEALAFNQFGTLYASDSNLGVVYTIPPGGGKPQPIIGPSGSDALINDEGLFQSPVLGLSPNGIAFSRDYKTLYVANTFADRVIAFDVNDQGEVTGNPRIFAEFPNDDLEVFPTGFEGLIQPDTQVGSSASTPLNGPDGLSIDNQGRIWAPSVFGDNLTILSPEGKVEAIYRSSAVTANGLLNAPTNVTFVGDQTLVTNLGLFTGLAGENRPFTVVSFDTNVSTMTVPEPNCVLEVLMLGALGAVSVLKRGCGQK